MPTRLAAGLEPKLLPAPGARFTPNCGSPVPGSPDSAIEGYHTRTALSRDWEQFGGKIARVAQQSKSEERGRRSELVRQSIVENARIDSSYIVMNCLATVVACYGLLLGSTAVVIGAMIIATLLGPIMGIALSIVDGNQRLLRTSVLAETFGVALVIGLAILVGRVHREIPMTTEIISRTQPNFFDLMVALGGGAAGAFATVSEKVSSAIVGVAVSTALVPPLAASGLCLARGEGMLAWGAFVLFVTNLVAIQLASSIVLWAHGYHGLLRDKWTNWRMLLRNSPSLLLTVILAVGLTVNLTSKVADQLYENKVRTALQSALGTFPGVRLADLWIEERRDKVVIMAVVRAPYSLSPDTVANLEREVPTSGGRRIELHVRSVLTKEATAREYLHEPVQPRPSAQAPDDESELTPPKLGGSDGAVEVQGRTPSRRAPEGEAASPESPGSSGDAP